MFPGTSSRSTATLTKAAQMTKFVSEKRLFYLFIYLFHSAACAHDKPLLSGTKAQSSLTKDSFIWNILGPQQSCVGSEWRITLGPPFRRSNNRTPAFGPQTRVLLKLPRVKSELFPFLREAGLLFALPHTRMGKQSQSKQQHVGPELL